MTFSTRGTRGVSARLLHTFSEDVQPEYSAGRIRKTGKFGELPSLVPDDGGQQEWAGAQDPLAYFPADGGGWLIVASYAGAAKNPAWYYNLAAHPDRVSIEIRRAD